MSATTDGRGVVVETATPIAASALSRVSWGAILAGAVVAIGIGSMLNLLGAATGFAMVDAIDRDTPEAASFAWMSGLFLAVTTAIGLFVGTAVAARLAGTWNENDALLHGLVTWAAAILLAAVLVGSAVTGGIGASVRAAGGAASAVASGAGAAASAFNPAELMEYTGTRFFGRTTPGEARAEVEQEAVQLLADRIRKGRWDAGERERMVVLVANLTDLPPAEAEQRLVQAEQAAQTAMRQAEETARKAADAAATALSVAAFWAFATALLGLGAAALGAKYGARGPLMVVARSDLTRPY